METQSELAGKMHAWEQLYRQLLTISRDQRNLIATIADNERFGEQFHDLTGKWETLQNEIAEIEQTLRTSLGDEELRRRFASTIAPIARLIQTNINQTTEQMKRAMAKTGVSIRDMNERRNVRNAYADADYEGYQAMFFDEKK